jgi:hypothetical protein
LGAEAIKGWDLTFRPPRLEEFAIHPLDKEKLQRLGEILFDISAGNLALDRADLLHRVGILTICVRDDLQCSGASEVVDRIIALADHRLGAKELAMLALAEIKLGDAGPTPFPPFDYFFPLPPK